MLARALRRRGYDTRTAASVEEARSMPDLALAGAVVDLNMADADEVLNALFSNRTRRAQDVLEQRLSVDRLEWEHLQRVLADHGGNISAIARALNMHRRTLQRKLGKRPVAK